MTESDIYMEGDEESKVSVEVEVVPYSSSAALSVALWQHEQQESMVSDTASTDSASTPDRMPRVSSYRTTSAWSAFIVEDEDASSKEDSAQEKEIEDDLQSKSSTSSSFLRMFKKNKFKSSRRFGNECDSTVDEQAEGKRPSPKPVTPVSHTRDIGASVDLNSVRSNNLDALFSDALVHAKQKERQNIKARAKKEARQIILEAKKKHERRNKQQS